MRGQDRLTTAALLAAALAGQACNAFRRSAPDGPSPVLSPHLVSVAVEYLQPRCQNVVSSCDGPVVFFGSWMRPGGEFNLAAVSGTFVWTGTATGVPVNFPPRDQPYLVRVFDPHLRDTANGGFTPLGLRVGSQIITQLYSPGTPQEAGFIYVDDNGVGHSPF